MFWNVSGESVREIVLSFSLNVSGADGIFSEYFEGWAVVRAISESRFVCFPR